MAVFFKRTPYGDVRITAIQDNTNISIQVDGIKQLVHKYPLSSYVRDNTLYLSGCTFKNKKLSGVKDLPKLQAWYNKAKNNIKNIKKQQHKKEIIKAKEADTVKFTVSTAYGFNSTNKYISDITRYLELEHANSIVEDLNIKPYEVYCGDYNIIYYFESDYAVLKNAIIRIKKQISKERKRELKKSKRLRIARLKEKIKFKEIPYQNLKAIDVCVSTGLTFYTFKKRVDKELFCKVQHLFEYINTTNGGSDSFDPMFGTKFKGYATTQPKRVMEILYPNWIEEGLGNMEKEIRTVESELILLE